VHVLDWADPTLAIPDLGARVLHASMLKGGASVPIVQSPPGVTLTLPPADTDEPDRVIVLVTTKRQ